MSDAVEEGGLLPSTYHRPYLGAGHAANSPVVTGRRETVPMPEAHPAIPERFRRDWIVPGHQDESPDGG